MITQHNLKERIRSTYFELISDIAHFSYDELLSVVTNHLTAILNTTHSVIYIYNKWNKKYEIKTSSKETGMFMKSLVDFNDINQQLLESDISDGKSILREKSELLNFNSVIIPLFPKFGSSGFMFLSYPKDVEHLSSNSVELVKRETEQLLKLVNYYKLSEKSVSKSKFLFDMSTRLYSMNIKGDILKDIVQCLYKLYPTFTYYLLLSQDYEAESSLPIKTIEYSDAATKRVSTQAFLTGEVQLEDRVKDKNTSIYAPLRGKQGVYGVLQIITPHAVDFTEDEIDFITQFANTAGAAIENVTLYQHSKHLVSDLKLINEATHKLNSNLKLTEIISIVRMQIIEACRATQVGFIYINDKSDNGFDILSGSTSYFATKQGQIFAEDILSQMQVNTDPMFSGNSKKNLPYCSIMAIPMIHSGNVHGAVLIMHEEKYFFSFESYKLMQSLVQHSTLALTNSILKDKLEESVITDYLTKLYSRNHLDETLKAHMQLDEKGTLILFDIDDFKKINDTYGHYIGDEVIVQVAKIIRTQLGQEDIPARWGGEELAIYLPNASIDDGVALAGQIRTQVESFTEPKITLSCGVSSWIDKELDSVSDVFIRADKALYEAKEIGKNCVVKEKELKKHSNL
ncbi:sensor domain-containing diguanylate cyclase [Virgibacillus salinus]|uniref:Diguanylate cyclase with GAF sensor n=1 Tax=Virgibacillus salinus TaxID=553311 RepID=A0A1H1AS55_9BACI|nr:sensor domain-containing diguanylate cyclase [Virgibacillus salinus]SDQ42474.1 diguanylate cyclase with GAF sensor [Virgibacillus salinus]